MQILSHDCIALKSFFQFANVPGKICTSPKDKSSNNGLLSTRSKGSNASAPCCSAYKDPKNRSALAAAMLDTACLLRLFSPQLLVTILRHRLPGNIPSLYSLGPEMHHLRERHFYTDGSKDSRLLHNQILLQTSNLLLWRFLQLSQAKTGTNLQPRP